MKTGIFFTCFIVLNFLKVGSTLTANIYSDISYCHKEFIKPQNESISTNQLDRLNISPLNRSKYCYRYYDDYQKDYCLQRVIVSGLTKQLITSDKHSAQCHMYNIEIEYSELKDAFQYLEQHQQNIDTNSTIKTIKITFVNSPTIAPSINYTYIGELIDNFLIPRPWWRVVKEPFEWQKAYLYHTIKKSSSSASHNSRSLESDQEIPSLLTINQPHQPQHQQLTPRRHLNENNQIIFRRVASYIEPHLHFIAATQYPNSTATCSVYPLITGSKDCGHPGWTSVLHMYMNGRLAIKYAIMTIFKPTSQEFPGDESRNFYMSEEDCRHKRNLWECAFLSMTNCSLPNKIEPDEKYAKSFTSLYTKATIDGRRVRFQEEKVEFQYFDKTDDDAKYNYSLPIPADYHYDIDSFKQTGYIYQLPYDATYRKEFFPIQQVEILKTAYIFGFILRQTALYRSKIQQLIHSFRTSSNFHPRLNENAMCAVAHLRRGDRGIYGKNINVTEYCYNATHNLKCMDRFGRLDWCNHDAGCGSGVPFAGVTLESVVTKVPLLLGPQVKNLLLFSDDMAYIKLQIDFLKNQSLYTDWSFYYLDVPHESLTSDKVHKGWVRYGKATESGVYLHASLQLAKQCSGFIGHLVSATSALFYQNMCNSHRGLEGVCPPAYNMHNGLIYRNNEVSSVVSG